MPAPWNDWYHIIIHTYGSWLPGDPRGHRTRHHREHVEGDYKNPPPDTPRRRGQFAHAKSLLKRPPIILTREQRGIVARELASSFARHDVLVAILCVDVNHAHVLAKIPERKPTDSGPWAFPDVRNPKVARIRYFVGIAKKDASRVLSDAGSIPPGGLWGKRSDCHSITDRPHQIATYRYIQSHGDSGAVVVIPECKKQHRPGGSPGGVRRAMRISS